MTDLADTQSTFAEESDASVTASRVEWRVYVPGIALLAVIAWGAVQGYRAIRHAPDDRPAVPMGWEALLDGRMTQTFEKNFDQRLPARPALIAAANSAQYVIKRGAGDQVRVGREEWLFLAEEVQYHKDGDANLRARAEMVGQVARKLEQRGVKLVVAVVPDKARIYESRLAGGEMPDYAKRRYADFLGRIRSAGVIAPDLATPLTVAASKQEKLYYSTDTHWNQNGARLVARELAATIGRLGVSLPEERFATSVSKPAGKRPGDLLKLMGLTAVPDAVRPNADVEEPVTTVSTAPAAEMSLFGDATPPVTLVGTSFSLRGNFHGYLQESLSARVLNLGADNAGFSQAITGYLTNAAFRDTPPQVLVWEIPERFLQTPLEKDRRVPAILAGV